MYPFRIVKSNTFPTELPPDLGDLVKNLSTRSVKVGYLQTCTEARLIPDLKQITPLTQPAVPLVNHASQ